MESREKTVRGVDLVIPKDPFYLFIARNSLQQHGHIATKSQGGVQAPSNEMNDDLDHDSALSDYSWAGANMGY